ncbi:MAG: o-succinylbenzoate synthase [Phycisphaerae bacterium]|nr:o-succinylbenzoate synthase [Phycisphaerae bacterium]
MVISIARYRSRLRTPMRFGGETFQEREGFFVAMEGPAGIGIGEVAPLPGVHRESLDRCLAALASSGGEPRLDHPPSLAFGLDIARAFAYGDPVLCRPLRPSVGVNELLADGGRPSGSARTVKVKVGRGPIELERAMLAEIIAACPAARLRIDANRSLTLDEAKKLFEGLDPARVEYLEEPLSLPLELPALHFATGLSIALDESLHEPRLRAALETAPGVVAHVIKPSLIGGILAVRERAERTARQGLRTTVTSTFESSYTLRVLARLITWLPATGGEHGLGTAGLLLDDPCIPPLVRDWSISTEGPVPTPTLPFVQLERPGG